MTFIALVDMVLIGVFAFVALSVDMVFVAVFAWMAFIAFVAMVEGVRQGPELVDVPDGMLQFVLDEGLEPGLRVAPVPACRGACRHGAACCGRAACCWRVACCAMIYAIPTGWASETRCGPRDWACKGACTSACQPVCAWCAVAGWVRCAGSCRR